jgi:general secretion pathway protein B
VPDLAESQAVPPDDPAAQLQLELERQLESDGAVVPDSESAPLPTLREDPGPTPVPPDLIAAIEDFKHQVQGGPGKDKAKEKGAQKAADLPVVPPTPRPPGAPADVGDPATQLRLTHEQEAALPKFVMSVHVYDAQPDRRFVLINGLKYAEGAKTREGLTVERIRVDGAVLMHEGHPFFVHR